MSDLPEFRDKRTPDDLARQLRLPDGSAAGAASPQPGLPPLPTDRQALFANRELSWLAFNRRVLAQALDETQPLLERVKFLAIASSNLDEFFEIRVAGLMELIDANLSGENPDNLKPIEELQLVREQARTLYEQMHRAYQDHLVPALAKAGYDIRSVRQLPPPQRQWLDSYFEREIHPVLTPLALDPAHPFPVLLNRSLNLAVMLLDPRQTRRPYRLAVVQVPRVLPRILRIPDHDGRRTYVLTADIVQQYLPLLFPGLDVLHSCSFRVTRDGNLEVDEIQATDLLSSIEKELIKRRRGEPVRLEIDHGAHPEVVERFTKAFGLDTEDVYFCDGPVNLARLMELYQLIEAPEHKDPPLVPRRVVTWTSADDMFADLREADVLLHHPYESFATVEDFVKFAARDPRVLAIKQTIYRAGSKSVLIDTLIEAAQLRKQVTVVVELKARFDEEANIQWARRMEQAGVHVVYGIVGLKTHAKATLIVRREDDGIKRYCHLGTGNYNPTTARVYTDLGLLTAHPGIGEEVAEMFNMITGYTRVPPMQHLVVAPFALRDHLLGLIAKETENARQGRPAAIRAKLNNLTDQQVIVALYEASRAGVPIRLSVRGSSCLRAGVPGMSENITLVAIVDRFLEHSRVYYFENGGAPLVYVSSADWMIRNLDRRVEVATPILDPALKKRVVDEVLGLSLADNVKAWRLLPNGDWQRIVPIDGEKPLRSQAVLLDQAQKQPDPAGDSSAQTTRKRLRRLRRKG